jgi:hypothetical protein
MAQHKKNDLPNIPRANEYADITKHEQEQAEASGPPDLDETSPLAQTQPNQANRPTGGAGSRREPERRASQEQPGTGRANSLSQTPGTATTGVDPARVDTPAGTGYVKANPGLPSNVRVAEPPEGAGKDSGPEVKHPSSAPGAGNQVTLSPTDPRRETAEGQPYLDDANPFGRSLPNQQNRPLGGAGTWKDPQKRVSHEQPGVDAANPLPQALDPQPRRAPED